MKQVLKTYEIELLTKGPVYVGSGRDFSKREYTFSENKDIAYIFEPIKLLPILKEKKLYAEYEKYMMGNERMDIGKWLERKGIHNKDFSSYCKYQLDCSDITLEKTDLTLQECMKDPYGNPYIPGSSLKGMLRTILLTEDIRKNPNKYRTIKEKISKGGSGQKRSYLSREASDMEKAFANVLDKTDRSDNAVNDFMSGVIIGDSEPLSINDIILCQRTELNADGREKRLPVLRECIRPGVKIRFKLTIDESVCNKNKSYVVNDEVIINAVKDFCKMYNDCFISKYREVEIEKGNYVWLGGGCGFATKTAVYPMFGARDGVDVIVDIFRKTCVPDNHKHIRDKTLKVSPHICKVAYYKGIRYQMGKCEISIK